MRSLIRSEALVGAVAAFGMALAVLAWLSLTRYQQPLVENLLVVAFFDRELPDEKARAVVDQLTKQDALVSSALFVSKEEAFQSAQQNAALSRAMLMLKNNPFPSSVELKYTTQAWRERSDPAQALKAVPEITEVRWSVATRDAWLTLDRWRGWTQRAAIFLGLLLLISGFLRILEQRRQKAPLSGLFPCFLRGVAGALGVLIVLTFLLWQIDTLPQRMEWLSWLGGSLLAGGLAGTGFFGYKTLYEP